MEHCLSNNLPSSPYHGPKLCQHIRQSNWAAGKHHRRHASLSAMPEQYDPYGFVTRPRPMSFLENNFVELSPAPPPALPSRHVRAMSNVEGDHQPHYCVNNFYKNIYYPIDEATKLAAPPPPTTTIETAELQDPTYAQGYFHAPTPVNMNEEISPEQEEQMFMLDDDEEYVQDVFDQEEDDADENFSRFKNQVGLYGWKKKTTYSLLALVILLVIINLCLSVWIITQLNLTPNGIAGIKLSKDFIIFEGTAKFGKSLLTKEIKSIEDDSISFTSKRSIQFEANSDEGVQRRSKLTMLDNKIQLSTKEFEVFDGKRNRKVFGLQSIKNGTETQMTLNVESLNIENLNGLYTPFAIQTNLIQNSGADELRVFAPRGALLLRGPNSVAIESKLGDSSIITFANLTFKSNNGKIVLEASKSIYMRNLTLVETKKDNTKKWLKHLPQPEVFQLCVCHTGRLFLAKSNESCVIKDDRECH